MDYQVQYILNQNYYLKRFLRENSWYYKNIIRNPNFINEMNELMKKDYYLTLPDKLDKIKNNISLVNTFMDVLK